MSCSCILENLYVGSCPRNRADVEILAGMGIRSVLNLQTGSDLAYWRVDVNDLAGFYRETGIRLVRHPVPDFRPDRLAEELPAVVGRIRELTRNTAPVYLHCNVGVNRSPTSAIAFLTWVESRSLEEAARLVAERRPEAAPYLDAILAAEPAWRRMAG